MKMPRKVIISCLTLLSAFTLAGSISGTVAWYQYSTRATVKYTGKSLHSSKVLQLSVDNGSSWDSDIKDSQLPSVSFRPITTGAQEKDAPLWYKPPRTMVKYDDNGNPIGTEQMNSLFYAQPDCGQGLYENWLLAPESSYAQFEILVKVKDIDGSDTETKLSNDVYISNVTIEDPYQDNNLDLENAVRIHIATEYKEDDATKNKYFLFANETEDTEVGGFLDLDENGELDQEGYEWNRHTCLYGAGTFIPATYDDEGNKLTEDSYKDAPHQTSYKANDPTIIASAVENSGTPIGKTSSSDEYLKVTVTIWLEGWSILSKGVAGSQDTSIWDEKVYVDQRFNVGLTFDVRQHGENE